MVESSRTSISLPTYALGDEGKPNHFDASTTPEAAAEEAKTLAVGDAAFILRSDRKWAYSILTEKGKGEDESITLRFVLDNEKNVKRFPAKMWGKYIRVVKVDEVELAKLREEGAKNEAEKPEEVKPEEVIKPESEKMDAKTEEIKSDESKLEETKPEAGKPDVEPKDEGTKGEEAKPETDKEGENVTKSISEMGSIFSDFLNTVSKKMGQQKVDIMKKIDRKKTDDTENTEESKAAATETKGAVEAEASSSANDDMFSNVGCSVGLPWLSSWGSLFEGKSRKVGSVPAETTPKSEAKPETTEETKDEAREPAECTASTENKPKATPATVETSSNPSSLETPVKMFKAPSMKDDPANAAMANTSFAEDQAYDSITKNGAVVVEHDPSAMAMVEKLERERLYGPLESQGITIIETNCSVDTEVNAE